MVGCCIGLVVNVKNRDQLMGLLKNCFQMMFFSPGLCANFKFDKSKSSPPAKKNKIYFMRICTNSRSAALPDYFFIFGVCQSKINETQSRFKRASTLLHVSLQNNETRMAAPKYVRPPVPATEHCSCVVQTTHTSKLGIMNKFQKTFGYISLA